MVTENIVLYQNADFSRNISLTDANNQPLVVTGYFANAAMKVDPYADDPKSIRTIPIVFTTLLSNGNLLMSLSANTLATVPAGYYWYDVVVWNNTQTFHIGDGQAQVFPAIGVH